MTPEAEKENIARLCLLRPSYLRTYHLMALGYSIDQIKATLGVSKYTVIKYRKKVRRILGPTSP